jgi:thiol-disulfide isomerase/thioredoxin
VVLVRKYLVGLVVLAMLAAACGDDDAGTTSDGSSTTAVSIEQSRPVTITGTPLPRFPETGADSAVGMAMPELEGASFDGTPLAIRNDGRPKVLLFLTHWWQHCQSEVSDYTAAFEAEGIPEGVDVYSISTSPDPNQQNYPPSEWLEEAGWPISVLADSAGREAANAYGLTAFPFSVFVYSDGTIAARATGAIPFTGLMDAIDFLVANPTG